MSRINTNVASLRGLRNYNNSNKLLNTSLTRLSTGLQINSGKDNPSGLIASETLRLEVTTIDQSIKNSNRANNVIATADGALGEIGGLLNQIRGLVQEGLNDGALSQSEKEANQLQIDTALSAINRISSNTKFAGDKLIDGSKAFHTSTSTADAAKLSDLQVHEAILGTNTSIGLDATVTKAAEKAQLAYFGGGLSDATTLEVGGAKGNELVFLGKTASVDEIAAAINGVSDATGVTAAVKNGAKLGSAEGVKAELSAAVGPATKGSFSFNAIDGTASSLDFTAVTGVQASQTAVVGATAQATTGAIADDVNDTVTVSAVAGDVFDGAAGNAVSIEFVTGTAAAAPTAAYNGTDKVTVTLSTTGTDNTAAAVKSALEGALGNGAGAGSLAVTLADGDGGATDDLSDLAGTTTALAGGADNTLTIQANDSGDAGNNIQVNFATGAAEAVTVTGAGTAADPKVINFTVTGASTVDSLQALLAAGATQGATDANNLITLSSDDETATFTAPTAAMDLAGGVDEQKVSFTADAAGTSGDGVSVTVNRGATANSVSVSGNAVTFNLTNSATVADLVGILDDPGTADEVAAADLLNISYSGTGVAPSVAVANTQTATSLSGGVDAETVTFTADTAGAAGNDIALTINRGAGANSVSVDGSAVTINLTNTATINDLATLLDSPSTTGETAAAALLDISYTGANGGTVVGNTASAQSFTGGAEAAQIDITAKTAGAAGNNVKVQFQAAAVPDADASVALTGAGTAADPTVITFTLGTDSTGSVNSTVADIQALLSNAADGTDAATAASLIEIAPAEGTSTSQVIDATALNTATALANGSDSTTTLTVLDNRAAGSTGTLSVAFAVGTGDEMTATIGAADADGNQTITFNLVDDVDGKITSTVDDLKALIGSNSTLDGLLSVDGTQGGALFAQTATELQGGENAAVVLSSADYGSSESVSVSVLNGSFATTDTTGATTGRDTGTDIGLTINGQSATGSGLSGRILTSSLDAVMTFNESANVVGDKTSVSITGGGSLFQIGADVSAAGQIGVGLGAMNTARLGGVTGKLYELGTGNGKSLLDVGQGGVSGSDLVGIIDEALDKVTTLRGRLGSIQKNVIETNINTLGVALENISEARSQITDTDFAVETAAMTKAQILQQSGISVLAIANQNPQQVLSLLG